MLNKSKLDKRLWSEAINCAVYTLNRTVDSIRSTTPFELWFKRKPNVGNLRIFGEPGILLDRRRVTNWSEKGKEIYFVGYTDIYNTYRVYDGEMVIISSDVIFLNQTSSTHLEMNTTEDDSENLDESDDDFWVLNPETTQRVQEGIAMNESIESLPTLTSSSEDETNVMGQQPVSNLEQPSQVRNSSQQNRPNTSEVSTMSLFEKYPDQRYTIVDSNNQPISSIRIGDLKFDSTVGRWRDRKIGHFISREKLSRIKESLNSMRPNNPRAMLTASQIDIPLTYKEAVTSEFSKEWINAAEDEMKSLIKNNVFQEIDTHKITKKPVGSRWVFTVKTKSDGEVMKFKARVVAKGYSQIENVDYFETYTSVVSVMATRLMGDSSASGSSQIALILQC